ncbi:MAG: isocitrate lyase/phosphoenolpyruvate mutase family protein [Chloroflexi bacterium]|nr:isocitrate lyase/phosphoenolpyruvate mutase family protein [Chloroflexota bacterium]
MKGAFVNVQEKRQRYRRVLSGSECIYTASVYDPLSARMADSLGFPVGMLAGSVASAVVVGAPDLVVLTLTEFADLIHRITRYSEVSLMVDADHGYGNALSVMRTVEEVEAAGAAALTIEDTLLPEPFRKQPGQEMLSIEEMTGRLKAALAARKDPAFTIIGRTSALSLAGMDEAVKRVKAYSQLGVDALFLAGVTTVQHLQAFHAATSLPILLASTPASLKDKAMLASNGVRIALNGHQPFWAGVKAAYDALKHQAEGGTQETFQDRVASNDLVNLVTGNAAYARWRKEFLG